jgi:hypothetical protein
MHPPRWGGNTRAFSRPGGRDQVHVRSKALVLTYVGEAVIARELACPQQRTVHFVRSMLRHWLPAQRSLVSAALREVFTADGREQAHESVSELVEWLGLIVPKGARASDGLTTPHRSIRPIARPAAAAAARRNAGSELTAPMH